MPAPPSAQPEGPFRYGRQEGHQRSLSGNRKSAADSMRAPEYPPRAAMPLLMSSPTGTGSDVLRPQRRAEEARSVARAKIAGGGTSHEIY